MSGYWATPRTRGVGARDIHELTGVGIDVGPFAVPISVLIDLLIYPFSAWMLRGLTGQSVGDHVVGLVYDRPWTNARPTIWRCVLLDLLRFAHLPLSLLPVSLGIQFFAYRLAGLRLDGC